MVCVPLGRNGKHDSAIQLLERMQRNFVKLDQMEYLRKAQLSVIVLKVLFDAIPREVVPRLAPVRCMLLM